MSRFFYTVILTLFWVLTEYHTYKIGAIFVIFNNIIKKENNVWILYIDRSHRFSKLAGK